MGHRASHWSSRASLVDEPIYAPVDCTCDEVCDIRAVHEPNKREPSYFVTEAAFTTMAR